MSLATALRGALYHIRTIPGRFGLRVYSVAIVHRRWTGPNTGDGTVTTTVTPITEADGFPPKVRFLSAEERTVQQVGPGSVSIGPITPDFAGGGTAISVIRAWGQKADEVYVRLTGPRWPNGVEYQISAIENEKALHYTITAVP